MPSAHQKQPVLPVKPVCNTALGYTPKTHDRDGGKPPPLSSLCDERCHPHVRNATSEETSRLFRLWHPSPLDPVTRYPSLSVKRVYRDEQDRQVPLQDHSRRLRDHTAVRRAVVGAQPLQRCLTGFDQEARLSNAQGFADDASDRKTLIALSTSTSHAVSVQSALARRTGPFLPVARSQAIRINDIVFGGTTPNVKNRTLTPWAEYKPTSAKGVLRNLQSVRYRASSNFPSFRP